MELTRRIRRTASRASLATILALSGCGPIMTGLTMNNPNVNPVQAAILQQAGHTYDTYNAPRVANDQREDTNNTSDSNISSMNPDPCIFFGDAPIFSKYQSDLECFVVMSPVHGLHAKGKSYFGEVEVSNGDKTFFTTKGTKFKFSSNSEQMVWYPICLPPARVTEAVISLGKKPGEIGYLWGRVRIYEATQNSEESTHVAESRNDARIDAKLISK